MRTRTGKPIKTDKMIKYSDFTPEFKVFKKGRTDDWVIILNPNDGTFDIQKKKAFYTYLGYDVKDI